ncbi:MAG: HDIG domain-containing metalloprotein, partial [Myxococcota bacterium]|nr:HDIG domain-containing metalloprotein [Myxococcota bacterium]
LAGDRLLNYVPIPRSSKVKERLLADLEGHSAHLEEVTGVRFEWDEGQARFLLRDAAETYSREIARRAFLAWCDQGAQSDSLARIFARTQRRLDENCLQLGQRAAKRLSLRGIHRELLTLVGRLNYRTSYTQNQWQHAIEAAELAGMIAEELSMDPVQAKRATLLHDIGKVLWEETERVGSHAVSGAACAREYGENPDILHPIAAHHQDESPSSPLAFLVIAADTLSGARPGARVEGAESFRQHVEMLEGFCADRPEIQNYSIIQGGRELRISVDPRRLDDLALNSLTEDLAAQIEEESVYPGRVKVIGLRELRVSQTIQARARPRGEHRSTPSRRQQKRRRGEPSARPTAHSSNSREGWKP